MRNSFTVALGVTLILVALFYEGLEALAGRVVQFVVTDTKTVIRAVVISVGVVMLFPEVLAPVKTFTSSLRRGIAELRFYRYLAYSKRRNKLAAEQLKNEARPEEG
ncbi:MAG: hypothetical protein QW732_07070 [Zestosphaera sp.]